MSIRFYEAADKICYIVEQSLKDFWENKECLTRDQISWYLNNMIKNLSEDDLKKILDSLEPEDLKAVIEILIESPEWLGFKYQYNWLEKINE